jgi:hypothetical protein
MTQEDKSLLLKDLCGRLYCGVICQIYDNKYGYKLLGIDGDVLHIDCPVYDEGDGYVEIDYCKPYLRPMSSMTEEEKETYHNLCYEEEREELEFGEWAARIHYHDTIDSIDYLNSIHIDYRDLIPKGLAIEAPEGMYKF